MEGSTAKLDDENQLKNLVQIGNCVRKSSSPQLHVKPNDLFARRTTFRGVERVSEFVDELLCKAGLF